MEIERLLRPNEYCFAKFPIPKIARKFARLVSLNDYFNIQLFYIIFIAIFINLIFRIPYN